MAIFNAYWTGKTGFASVDWTGNSYSLDQYKTHAHCRSTIEKAPRLIM